MKHLIFSAVSLLLFSSYSFSQQNEASKEESNQRGKPVDLKSLDQRHNYHWQNGTTSTPSGRESAPFSVEGSYIGMSKQTNAQLRVPSYQPELSNATSDNMSQLDPRKVYHWKDGTTSTPSGHEATPVGGGYASLRSPKEDRPVSNNRRHPDDNN